MPASDTVSKVEAVIAGVKLTPLIPALVPSAWNVLRSYAPQELRPQALQQPIKLDTAGSAKFVARVQADALLTIAAPLIEELSKRPQTAWGDIIAALREKANELDEGSLPPKE
jgi:hypothetical protein